MKPLFSLLCVAALTVAPGVLAAPHEGDDDEPAASQAALPTLELSPQLLYRYLLAEIAGQRGAPADAAEIVLGMARDTRDLRFARRATEMALHARRPDLALTAARLWLELDTSPSSHARQTVAGLLATLGRFDELTREVELLLAAEPQQLGQNLLRLGRYSARATDRAAVRRLIDTVTAPYLGHPEAHFVRAHAAYELRDLPAARDSIRRALEIKPDWAQAALLQAQFAEQRIEAIDELGRFLRQHPQAREVRHALARTLVSEKRYDEARREFRKLLEQAGPDDAPNGDALFAVAVLSLQLGDTGDAERHLKRLIDIGHAESDKARLYLGQIAAEAKRWDEAVRWFSAIGPGESYLTARLQAASTLGKHGQLDAARQLLRESTAGDVHDRVRLLIGEAQVLRDASQAGTAYAVLAAGLQQYPDQPELLYEVALTSEKLGRHDELESRLRRLLALQPEHAHAHNALGYSFAERNIRLDEAKRLIDRALELAPNDPFILDSKGWILFRLGDKEKALDFLNQAFGLRADPEIAAHLGEVLWLLGRQSEARAAWDKARAEHPGNEVLVETIKRFLP